VTEPKLDRLRERLAEVTDLSRVSTLLFWDQRVMMPPGGSASRAEALATLGSLAQERFVAADIGELLEGRGGNEVAFLGVIGNELFGAPMRAVVDGHAHAVRREIAREASAYGAEPNDPDLLLGHAATLLR